MLLAVQETQPNLFFDQLPYLINQADKLGRALREIRRAGYALTDSEVAKGRFGLAAPISRDGQVIAGISLVAIPSKTERAKLSAYTASVVTAATRISNALSKETPVVPP
jgi:DNA-binding IclR family transcriptional regulator